MKVEFDKDKYALSDEAVYAKQYVDELKSEALKAKQEAEDGTIPVFNHVADLSKALEK